MLGAAVCGRAVGCNTTAAPSGHSRLHPRGQQGSLGRPVSHGQLEAHRWRITSRRLVQEWSEAGEEVARFLLS
jgi:hypothetical protein